MEEDAAVEVHSHTQGVQPYSVEQKNAVVVRNGYKSLGKGSGRTQVLRGLDITVPKGCIYGLLGASGCGKTTLLHCVVGRRDLDSGSVWVLGGKPGCEDSGVPGSRLGYMPQELALMDEFTIRETFLYFSWIYGMNADELDEKIATLQDVLELPPLSNSIKKLSTGQQRRVSLGAALLHDPELLVLDEPTVGVDPVLRQRIWDHLLYLTSKANRTIIVTTHYIEEARQADYVGLMRGGCLVAESSPDNLLRVHNADTLEIVFLELCRRQNAVEGGDFGDNAAESCKDTRGSYDLQKVEVKLPKRGGKAPIDAPKDEDHEMTEIARHRNLRGSEHVVKASKHTRKPKKSFSRLYGEWKALHFKNLIRFIRNPGILGFVFFFPILQIVLYFMAIGGDPQGLSIAVVNQETNFPGDELYSELRPVNCTTYISKGLCDDPVVSCAYLQALMESKFMAAQLYSDQDSALEAVRRGKAWGAVVIPENFTKALTARREQGAEADPQLVSTGDVEVHLDMSNQHLSNLIRSVILSDLQGVLSSVIKDCGVAPSIGSKPMKFNDPVFGDRHPTFQSFTTPAVIITTVFFLAVGLAATLLVVERTEGIWDRLMVMGITPRQLLESHLEWQILLVCGQIFEVAILMLFVYQIELRGSVLLLLILMFLQGLSGMAFGFVVSICSKHVSEANYMATGSFIPIIVTSGAMWPLEGMPWLIRYLSYAMPSTMATEALRSIMFRGWGFSMTTVYLGFVTTIAWILFFMVTCCLLLKYKKT